MSVKFHHPEYDEYYGKWKRCEDAAEGQDAIHAGGEAYLSRLKDQTDDDYKSYVCRTPFYNATWRTISGLSGMLFRKPPKIEVPPVTEALLDTVTEDGQPIGIFAREIVEECLTVGRVGILVDHPTLPVGVVTKADALPLNLRPTMAVYEADSIINWREAVVNNRRILTMVVLVEEQEVRKDEFESECKEVYRVLDLIETTSDMGAKSMTYRVRLFEIDPKTQQDVQIGDDLFPLMNNQRLDFIPFYFLSADDTCVEPDDPPLIDLVDMNLSHYRVSADYEHGCHFTGLPTGYVAGHTVQPGEKLYLGSQTMLIFPDPTTTVGFLEFSGAGLGSLRTNLDTKEKQMAILGARMLEAQKAGIEAAETAGIHRAGENSLLAATAQAISLGMTAALQTFSNWAGGQEDVSFELNRDFFPAPLNPQELQALIQAWQAGAISMETLFENLQAGQIIAEGKTLEDEQTQINDSMNVGPQLKAAKDLEAMLLSGQQDTTVGAAGNDTMSGGAA